MVFKIGDVVLPGDEVSFTSSEQSNKSKILLGPGLRQQNGRVFACKSGIFKQKSANSIWVDAIQRKYSPSKGETVIGLVVQKAGDTFRVEFGANEPATLPCLAFEGATKKNRPVINVGDLVFAKLLVAYKDFESELICVDSMGKKQKLGVLRGGLVFNCSINLARKLRNSSNQLMESIQKHINVPFEIAIGMNGRIWVNTKQEHEIITIANIILAADHTIEDDVVDQCVYIETLLASTVHSQK